MSEVKRTLVELAHYPEHEPREADPYYKVFHHARRHLIDVLKVGCWIGGANIDDIKNGLPKDHRCYGATQLEAHHDIAEQSGLNEIDWQKVAKDFPQAGINSDDDFRNFVEGEGGLSILCDKHHRSPYKGIHSITYPVWKLDRYAKQDWEFLEP